MKIFEKTTDFLAWRDEVQDLDVGFVPTMGALHAGHEALLARCAHENSVKIASIFVNPTQFLPGEDFEKYPRALDQDLEICARHGISAVFAPNISEIYSQDFRICAPKNLATVFEGALRPGHFDGVCTVVAKLFALTRPLRAYFGKKDLQQLLILRAMKNEFFLAPEIVACEIVRDENGLALSSRNAFLEPQSKIFATEISRALFALKKNFDAGENRSEILLKNARQILKNVQPDYFEIIDFSLQPVENARSGECAAIFAGKIFSQNNSPRLLDNIWL